MTVQAIRSSFGQSVPCARAISFQIHLDFMDAYKVMNDGLRLALDWDSKARTTPNKLPPKPKSFSIITEPATPHFQNRHPRCQNLARPEHINLILNKWCKATGKNVIQARDDDHVMAKPGMIMAPARPSGMGGGDHPD